jgi:hypothetical protein
MHLVGARTSGVRGDLFDALTALAARTAGVDAPACRARAAANVPYVDEPWYCCAEPNPDDLRCV